MQKRELNMRWSIFPTVISLLCFVYFMNFLVRYGEMLPTGSDEVANTAYAITAFGDVHKAGWSVPKPSHMLILGITYGITKNLWFVNMVFLMAAALLVYYACRIMDRNYGVPIPSLVFTTLVMTMPFSFGATLRGGSGLLSTLSIFIVLLYIDKLSCLKNRIMVIVFFSIANLTRPDNWVSTYLMVFFIFALKYLPKSRPEFEKKDLLFLIPMGMPVVWHLLDYAIFGDLFYSTHIAKKFVVEYRSRKYVFDWHRYPKLVKSFFFSTFYLSSLFSIKTVSLIALCVIGIVTMFMKQRRTLLFMTCPFLGTIVFYFVTYINGMLFLRRFLFYNYIFVFFVLSVGIAQFSKLALSLPVKYLRNFIQIAVACLIIFYFVYNPFNTTVINSVIPRLKNRSVAVKRENRAINFLKNDIELDGNNPVVATNLLIPSSRVSLKLGTGKDIYLLEKLVGLKRLGVKDFLPDLENRIIYLGYHKSVSGNIKKLIQKIEKEAEKAKTIFDDGRLQIHKCFY